MNLFTPETILWKFRSYVECIGTDTSGAVENARNRNLARWPGTGHLGSDQPEFGQLDALETWVTARLAVVDRLIDSLPASGAAASDPAVCSPFVAEPFE